MKRRRTSVSKNYRALFENWEIAVAVRLVNQFQTNGSVLEREDFEDLMQECLTHWFFKRDKYKPTRRASKQTFMAEVLRRKLMDLVKERKALIRRAAYEAVSLDAPINEGDPDRTFLRLIDDATAEAASGDAIVLIPFRMRLAKAWPRLSERERALCRLRMDGLTMSEAREALGISKDTAYEMRKRIQNVFEKEKLRGFFK
jgi:RNA polymerase sigma-70 factor (ECF subfamily)